MTVIILTASYRDIEFVRVGYYVNTYYEDEARQAEPPKDVDFDGLCRNVLVEKPKVTRSAALASSSVMTDLSGSATRGTTHLRHPNSRKLQYQPSHSMHPCPCQRPVTLPTTSSILPYRRLFSARHQKPTRWRSTSLELERLPSDSQRHFDNMHGNV